MERIDRTSRTVLHDFGGGRRGVAQPLTFTPFASAQACSARCAFCSETLLHREARVLGASLRPGPDYPAALRAALEVLRGLPIGISLSGLESTDDPAWLADVLDAIDAHGAVSPVEERVLYTNTRGLAGDAGKALLERLVRFGLARAEVSRHAVDAGKNQAIMRFRDDIAVADNAAFGDTVRRTATALPVRMVCVVQRGGVESPEDARAYVAFARSLGVTDVVFRELSRTGDQYKDTRSLRLADDRRVPVMPLRAFADEDGYAPVEETLGYYFQNVRYRRDDTLVTFEHSDFVDMKARHGSDVIYKLVFFANGALCGDWDPERQVLWRAG